MNVKSCERSAAVKVVEGSSCLTAAIANNVVGNLSQLLLALVMFETCGKAIVCEEKCR